MMEEDIYLTGNTIRLTGTFKDVNGDFKDPTLIKIIFYNYKYEKIDEISIGSDNRLNVGMYFYDYIAPMQEQRVYYEWYGEIEGNPAIQRKGFQTKFMI